MVPEFPAFPESPPPEGPRLAIYFAPDPRSALARFGARWLGRDCAGGEAPEQPAVLPLSKERLRAITESARRYGFHATLKPPFHLKPGIDQEELVSELTAFAVRRQPFQVRLGLRSLGGFLALMMTPPDFRMDTLAADVVRDFDRFRAPPGDSELTRRRAADLSAQQEALLQRWGYPYVMGEFRFHMTLTSRMPEGSERDAVCAALALLAADATSDPIAVDGLALFQQDTRDGPFNLLQRFVFEG